MTTDDFTTAARAEAEGKCLCGRHHETTYTDYAARREQLAFAAGAEWARTHLAAQEQDTARIIDTHRMGPRFVGFGVNITCTCGESVRGEGPVGPQTDEDNAHRDAERKHAAHVADMLSRRDEATR